MPMDANTLVTYTEAFFEGIYNFFQSILANPVWEFFIIVGLIAWINFEFYDHIKVKFSNASSQPEKIKNYFIVLIKFAMAVFMFLFVAWCLLFKFNEVINI